jgi:hypothetical protein
MVGVAMECRKSGESKVIKYCGPVGKFVSCAVAIPVTANTRSKKPGKRIGPPYQITSLSLIIQPRAGQLPESLDSTSGFWQGF